MIAEGFGEVPLQPVSPYMLSREWAPVTEDATFWWFRHVWNAMSKERKSGDSYSDQEAGRRFRKALRGALSTPPKPLKSIAPKEKDEVQKEKPRRSR